MVLGNGGEYVLPRVSKYTYLCVDLILVHHGMCISRMCWQWWKEVIRNMDINLCARRLLLLVVVRQTLEWE